MQTVFLATLTDTAVVGDGTEAFMCVFIRHLFLLIILLYYNLFAIWLRFFFCSLKLLFYLAARGTVCFVGSGSLLCVCVGGVACLPITVSILHNIC